MKNNFLTFGFILIALGFVLAPSPSANAMGSSPIFGDGLSNSEELALNLAVLYAKNNPQYAPVLTALNIEDGNDVKAFMKSDKKGDTFDAAVAYLVDNYSKKDPTVKEKLNDMGIHNSSDLRNFMANPFSGVSLNQVLQLAIDYAKQNPEYAKWLEALDVNTSADLLHIWKGNNPDNNLQDQLIKIGKAYNDSPEKADEVSAKLYPYLQTGSFQGLPLEDIAAISH